MDEQFDIFGGSTMVTRKRNRPAAAPEAAVQVPLFAIDADELDGQAAAVDPFGEVAGEVACDGGLWCRCVKSTPCRPRA